ncbi:MAG: OmpA family protein [Cyclobacteriaceae bacterium]|nr:OmpA family protein [Cyclobacteriaceae bacterium]
MKLDNKVGAVLLTVLLWGGFETYAQTAQGSKELIKAEKLFLVGNFDEALPLFLEAEKAGNADELLNYKIARCYSASTELNERIKAIPYFEKVDESALNPIPPDFYLIIGDAYVANEQIEQALIYYNKQLKVVARDARAKASVEGKISSATIAYEIMRIPKNVTVVSLGSGINSTFTEYNPVVSADESILAYTSLKPVQSKSGEKLAEEILISYNKTGTWSVPVKVDVATENNYGTAGITADGQEMLVFIGDHSSGSIYKIQREENGWSRPMPLGDNIHSKYMESTASMTPDNKTIYFASNRPGGYGGMDIYKSEKKPDGSWGKAENLGKTINSKANEDAPFIHPNKKMLFFTTDGHKGMGGNDIYKSELIDGVWSVPKNMGYPINTTADDNYFTLIADGSRGYFSSDRKGGSGGQDIYAMDMPENYETIPLTMIKGRILDAETQKPMPTKIYMIDNETSEKIDYMYHPNPKTGDYLVILPPSQTYDMIIESEGFLPYTLNIDVPDQKEFYELYQKIYLKTIKHFDVVVGQEVEIKNAFYNTQAEGVVSLRKEHEAALIDNDSIDVYELMGQLMEAGDQSGMDYLVELLLIKNPIDSVDFDNSQTQSAKRVYYYDESDESKFEKKQVDGEVIFSLPTMCVTKEAEAQKAAISQESQQVVTHISNEVLKIFFDAGKSDLESKYESNLKLILDELNNKPNWGIEISGYASNEGNEDFNKKLSNERAKSVLDYFNHRGIVRRRIVAIGYGATESSGLSKEESRRVEVRLVDLGR